MDKQYLCVWIDDKGIGRNALYSEEAFAYLKHSKYGSFEGVRVYEITEDNRYDPYAEVKKALNSL